MRFKQVVELAVKVANGKNYFKEGAVGSNGYGFVFKDFNAHPIEPYMVPFGSHKLCGAGSHRDVKKKLERHEEIEDFSDVLRYDMKYDLLIVGSLKNLLPTLQFGGIEQLFEVWMFVKTPEDQKFPATFYWGQSGLSIGGWSKDSIYLLMREKGLSNELEFINFNLFELSDDEIGRFLDALEFALKKVTVSDFWGIYKHDLGNSFMGIKKGKPFIKELGSFKRDSEAEREIEPLLEKEFQARNGEKFTINLLSEIRVYFLQFESSEEDKIFGSAKKILNIYKGITSTPDSSIC
ncbi:MAG: hypothetical protein ACFFCI_13580 [Promethearchaeota archaeon]